MTPPWRWSKLTLGPNGRHSLADRVVECGDSLEVMLQGGRTVEGRYEWDGQPQTVPYLVFVLVSDPDAPDADGGPHAAMPLPQTAWVRWPYRSATRTSTTAASIKIPGAS